MNILLLDSGNTYNYGSMMMAENFIYYSEKKNPGNSFFIETENKVHVKRLRKATGLDNIYMVSRRNLIWCKKFRIALMLHKMRINVLSKKAKSMDKLIFLGGDDFTEIYGKEQLVYVTNWVDMLKNKNNFVALVGQTIGPFGDDIEDFILKVLKKMDAISVRDPETARYLKEKKLVNYKEVADLALLPLAKEPEDSQRNNQVLFCPSEIMYQYAQIVSRDEFIALGVKMCQYVSEKLKCEILMLPHVYDDRTNGDSYMMKEIWDNLDEKCRKHVKMYEEELLPYEVRKIIKESRFVIAQRMHPAISGLECETPSLVFSYGRKYEGIFEQLYDLKDLVIDMRNYSDYGVLWEDCRTVLDDLNDNFVTYSQKISEQNKRQQPLVEQHICELVK